MCGCPSTSPTGDLASNTACALTGNGTSDPLPHRPVLNLLSHTSQSWFFEKINKIQKPLTRLMKKKERTETSKIRNERERLQMIPLKYKGL